MRWTGNQPVEPTIRTAACDGGAKMYLMVRTIIRIVTGKAVSLAVTNGPDPTKSEGRRFESESSAVRPVLLSRRSHGAASLPDSPNRPVEDHPARGLFQSAHLPRRGPRRG